MDSYFLSETLKYLYLLFDENNKFNKEDYVFTTEGHMFKSIKKNYSLSKKNAEKTKKNKIISYGKKAICQRYNNVGNFFLSHLPSKKNLDGNILKILFQINGKK